jgi:hypothetical protein
MQNRIIICAKNAQFTDTSESDLDSDAPVTKFAKKAKPNKNKRAKNAQLTEKSESAIDSECEWWPA